MRRGNVLASDTVAAVLAGGEGTRLGALTRHTCKPALPFGAAHRTIDFSLANCVNSGIKAIGVVTQHKPDELQAHVANVWNGQGMPGSYSISAWPAVLRAPATGYRGTADAVFRNLEPIEAERKGLVLVLAGDHIYKMDYRPMLQFHRERRAAVTVGCVEVPRSEASQFGILSTRGDGRIDSFVEKPSRVQDLATSGPVMASMGIYVFDTSYLASVLRRDAASDRSRHDFGRDILPSMLPSDRVFAYPFANGGHTGAAYWRDVGTPGAYWRAHLDLLDNTPALRLDDARWPLPYAWGGSAERWSRRDDDNVPRKCSLVAAGCRISGRVHRSVLSPGVHVMPGSSVDRSVVLPGAVIGRNARITGAIVDSNCRIPDGTVIAADFAGRGDAEEPSRRPVIVTADDFSPELVRAYA